MFAVFQAMVNLTGLRCIFFLREIERESRFLSTDKLIVIPENWNRKCLCRTEKRQRLAETISISARVLARREFRSDASNRLYEHIDTET